MRIAWLMLLALVASAKADGPDPAFLRDGDLLTRAALRQLARAGLAYQGKPYDPYFGWGDDRIYCSELVYKVYRDAIGIEMGKTRRMKDFDLTGPAVQAQLRERYGDSIPLDETVIAPSDLFLDSNWVEVKFP